MILMQESREEQHYQAPEQRRSSSHLAGSTAARQAEHRVGGEQFSGPFWMVDLQARYFDVIDRYVRKRVSDPERAREIVNHVFAAAAVSGNAGEVAASPLPWLIATARRACARSLLGEYSPLYRAIA